MFTIGEFSKITGLTIKAIRFYHAKEVLIPARVEAGTGYRFFDHKNVESARVIVALRNMEFSVGDIRSILSTCDQDKDMLEQLQQRKHEIEKKIQSQSKIMGKIDHVIAQHEGNRKARQPVGEIEVREIPEMLVAGIRITGKYSEMGSVFGRLGRNLGRHIAGPSMCLYYDDEYKEDDANFEPAFPIRKDLKLDGISNRLLPACRAVCIVHVGPYENIGHSYEQVFGYLHRNEMKQEGPSREVFLKGPGIIFKGNPKKYATEIQIAVA